MGCRSLFTWSADLLRRLFPFSNQGRSARARRIVVTTALVLFVATSVVLACSVPVFRYALEHWRPDPYVAFVFHSGDLTEEQQAVVQAMQPRDENGQPAANVFVKAVDVQNDSDPVTQKIWQEHQSQKLPWLVVHSPPKWGPPQTIWQGEFNKDNAGIVMDSPARSTISKRLVDGESVVWAFLECGRKEEDDAAYQILTTELQKLEKKLKLPEIETEDLGDLSVAPDSLRVAFSAVRISRDDVRERAFVDMLLRVEPDLLDEDVTSQPMAFPVFGRGRALYALVGKGIAPDVIKDASEFLCGACQCTVKAQNPGVDLIMNVDWEKLVVPTEPLDEGLPPLAGFSGFGVSEEDHGTKNTKDDGPADNDDAQGVSQAASPDSSAASDETTDVLVAQAADHLPDSSSGSRPAGTETSDQGHLPAVASVPSGANDSGSSAKKNNGKLSIGILQRQPFVQHGPQRYVCVVVPCHWSRGRLVVHFAEITLRNGRARRWTIESLSRTGST